MAMDDGRPALAAGLRERLRERGLTRRRLRVGLHAILHPARPEDRLEGIRVFLGTGLGRSGTRFLSGLLDGAPGACVAHEPVHEDMAALRRAYCSPARRRPYLRWFRVPEIELRLSDAPPAVYGEVNSHLRRHARALRDLLPSARVFHLVRDGRDVVRSMYARDTFRPGDRATRGLRPCPGDPYRARWDGLTLFERLCWYWASENAFVRTRSQWTVRLEDVVSDYEAFREALLEPLGLEVERGAWERAVDRPRNVTRSHDLPPPDAWEPERRRVFWDICGDEMRRCGYA